MPQEESIVSRFEADVLSVIAYTLTQAGTAARWERHGIGAQELAMHLLDTSAGVKSATGTCLTTSDGWRSPSESS
jgi:hypothetical protein